MTGITGQGTTYNLPNYVGDLFAVSPDDTPFLSAIGGLTGGKKVKSTKFGWQSYDLRAAAANRQRTEGADAPNSELRSRSHAENVVEIHQETVEVSYTKQAATNMIDSAQAGVEGSNPVTDEFAWQIDKQLKQMARDIEITFLTGTYQDGADTAGDGVEVTPRKTRGLTAAIATNVITLGTAAAPTMDDLNDLAQLAWDNGGLSEGATATLMTNSNQKRALTAAFFPR